MSVVFLPRTKMVILSSHCLVLTFSCDIPVPSGGIPSAFRFPVSICISAPARLNWPFIPGDQIQQTSKFKVVGTTDLKISKQFLRSETRAKVLENIGSHPDKQCDF